MDSVALLGLAACNSKVLERHHSENTRQASERISQIIYRQLFEAIKGGRLVPGDRLPTETQLTKDLGVSRNIVRKALARLEGDCLIRRQIGSGTYVLHEDDRGEGVDPGDGLRVPRCSPLDVLEARAAIEPGFSSFVCMRATDQDFKKMETRLREMETAGSQTAFREAGYLFHLEVARATRNPLLVGVFEMVIAARRSAGWEKISSLNSDQMHQREQIANNRNYLEALRERNHALARRLSLGHLSKMISEIATLQIEEETL